MLSPSWTYLKVGPYLRRERDHRQYTRLFQFDDYVTGWRRWRILATMPRVPANDVDLAEFPLTARNRLVVFRNAVSFGDQERAYFPEILESWRELHADLRRMTRPQYLPGPLPWPHIAVHVRMGDFVVSSDAAELKRGLTNRRIPVSWYAQMLQGLRASWRQDMPAILYSDGSDDALRPVLQLPNVRRSEATAAITDLLAIAQATVLLSSGSGFSYWGSFLGQVPRISFPGQRLLRVLAGDTSVDREPEWESPHEVTDEFVQFLEASARGAR